MIKQILVWVCFCLLAACAQEDNRITIGEKLTIESEILGEDRPYWVYLPKSYNDGRFFPSKYPVLYLLDGNVFFHSATGVVQFMSSGFNTQIPELIVVAIPNTDRARDLTPTHSTVDLDGKEAPYYESSGGGDKFLKFISDELQPRIDSTYRTEAFNILVGHSLGGLLAAHAMLGSRKVFEAYISIDPALGWDEGVVIRRARSLLQNDETIKGHVYISMANTVVPDFSSESVKEPITEFSALLQSVASPELRVRHDYYEAEDHASVPLLSLYHGLLHIFDGYKPKAALWSEETAAISAHFENVSSRLGITLLPPESVVNTFGYSMLYGEYDVDQAIELFALNTMNYPGSYNAFDSLAEAYMESGDVTASIANYEKSLELNPDNQNAVDQLKVLRAQQQAN